jgi:hypothetical protein
MNSPKCVQNHVQLGLPVWQYTVQRFVIMGRSRKDPYSPHRGNFCRPEGEKKLFLIIVNVLGHPKGVGG